MSLAVTPRRHAFVPDKTTKGDTCEICGEVDAFGALHIPERGEFDYDDPQPEACDRCPHYRHPAECTGGYPGGAACRCGSAA